MLVYSGYLIYIVWLGPLNNILYFIVKLRFKRLVYKIFKKNILNTYYYIIIANLNIIIIFTIVLPNNILEFYK